jgi:predicted SAM-dependent methyltransferase
MKNRVRGSDVIYRTLEWLLSVALPKRIISEILFEFRMACRRLVYQPTTLKHCQKLVVDIRVNVGCGVSPTPGWVNFEISPRPPEVLFWDCRNPLPLSDGSVSAIYTEHSFEHFEFETEAIPLLREFYRTLKPEGVLRIVVPDAGEFIRLYAQADWAGLAKKRGLSREGMGFRDPWVGEIYTTKMQLINAIFRQSGEHKYAYDFETLKWALESVGFSDIRQTEYNQSRDPLMAADSAARAAESLYVEAQKARVSSDIFVDRE